MLWAYLHNNKVYNSSEYIKFYKNESWHRLYGLDKVPY